MRAIIIRLFVPLIALAALASSPAADAADTASIERQIAICAAIDGALDRLECFDGIAAAAGLAGPQPQPTAIASAGKWQVHRDRNPIDDSERVVLHLTAESGHSSNGDIITFVARCQSNKTEAYINWNDYLGDDSHDVYEDWKTVTIRVGDEKASRQQWAISTDNDATFAPNAIGLLREMAVTDAFLAQVTPYNESPVTAIFDTTGMAAALASLAETCGWDLTD
jgi:type VI secretion system protein VasI